MSEIYFDRRSEERHRRERARGGKVAVVHVQARGQRGEGDERRQPGACHHSPDGAVGEDLLKAVSKYHHEN